MVAKNKNYEYEKYKIMVTKLILSEDGNWAINIKKVEENLAQLFTQLHMTMFLTMLSSIKLQPGSHETEVAQAAVDRLLTAERKKTKKLGEDSSVKRESRDTSSSEEVKNGKEMSDTMGYGVKTPHKNLSMTSPAKSRSKEEATSFETNALKNAQLLATVLQEKRGIAEG